MDRCRDDDAQDGGWHVVSTHMLAIKCGHLTGWLDKVFLDCEGSSPGIHASQFPFSFPFSSVGLNLPAQDQPWSECAQTTNGLLDGTRHQPFFPAPPGENQHPRTYVRSAENSEGMFLCLNIYI